MAHSDVADDAALSVIKAAVQGQLSPEEAVKMLNNASVIKEVRSW